MKNIDIESILRDTQYLSPAEAKFIYGFLKKLPNKGRFLELGTGTGGSTRFFSSVLPGWTIYTVDGYGTEGTPPQVYGFHPGEISSVGVSKTYDSLHGLKNVIQIVSGFSKLPWELKVDVLFIDGSHDYESVKKDFDKFSPFVEPRGLIILDDYNYNWGVREFVEAELLDKWEIEATLTTAVLWRKKI